MVESCSDETSYRANLDDIKVKETGVVEKVLREAIKDREVHLENLISDIADIKNTYHARLREQNDREKELNILRAGLEDVVATEKRRKFIEIGKNIGND